MPIKHQMVLDQPIQTIEISAVLTHYLAVTSFHLETILSPTSQTKFSGSRFLSDMSMEPTWSINLESLATLL